MCSFYRKKIWKIDFLRPYGWEDNDLRFAFRAGFLHRHGPSESSACPKSM